MHDQMALVIKIIQIWHRNREAGESEGAVLFCTSTYQHYLENLSNQPHAKLSGTQSSCEGTFLSKQLIVTIVTCSTLRVKSKGHIVIPYTCLCESIKKICGRYGIQTHFKGGNTIKNLLVSLRIKTQWSIKVMPCIGIRVGTLAVMMST